jgi:hypothetical protein
MAAHKKLKAQATKSNILKSSMFFLAAHSLLKSKILSLLLGFT